jgi:hypothetical protein
VKRLVVIAIAAIVLIGCSTSSEPAGPPGLDRIDGPAQVDPSYDPFATTPPPVTDAGG